MEQRWGLPLVAWPSRLRPNYWDLVALPLVFGLIALLAWGGLAMSARYQVGEVLPISLDPWRLPEYALRTVLRMGWALVASLVFSLAYAALAAKSRQAEKILIPLLDILQSVPILGFLSITVTGFIGGQLMPNVSPEESDKVIGQLEAVKEFDMLKEQISRIEITKPRLFHNGQITITPSNGEPVKITLRNRIAYDRIMQLTRAFGPELVSSS